MSIEHIDVLVVGAGLSGIAAGYYLQTHSPQKTYAILEGRDAIGGTWDLFRYPGIRSDSDMYTFGYKFRPWDNPKAIADGESILTYLNKTASEFGIDKKIRYKHRVCGASWSSETGLWTVDVQQEETMKQMSCHFLFMCTGYYDYDKGYTPEFPGIENFIGQVIHPQKWQDEFDYTDKRVVIIGSGATAVTLVPTLAQKAEHVTMLQRSPTYIVSAPAEDGLANWMNRNLPIRVAYTLTRWKKILLGMYGYFMARKRPEQVKEYLIGLLRDELGEGFDIEKHFTPRYNPWDQRVCLVPDSDFFKAMKAGKASVVTDTIDSFTKNGIQLHSGETLEADMIITATGLIMKVMNGVQLSVDGETIKLGDTMAYKGMMYSDVPNLASVLGYTNASWTLKAELICEYVCRLINHMDKEGYSQCTPRLDDAAGEIEPIIDFTSGYVQRALDDLPSQGARPPWRLYQNYILDLMMFRFGKLDDGAMEFRKKQIKT